VHYDFSEIITDSGYFNVLLEVDNVIGNLKKGFGLYEEPLMYVAD